MTPSADNRSPREWALPITIRTATPADAARLAALAEQTFRETFAADNSPDDMEAYVHASLSPERLAAEIADQATTFLLASLDDAEPAVGYAKLRTGTTADGVSGPRPVELQRLYVRQAALGRGVGAALMRAALDAAGSAGHQTLWLGVWERNVRAIAFYERWGFRPVGAQVFQLGSDAQRDTIMARAIGPADDRALVRPFMPEDWSGVWHVLEPILRSGETYAYPRDLTEDEARRRWVSLAHEVFVAEDRTTGRILGSYFLRPNQEGPGAHVCNCGYAVAAPARGGGIATLMCEHSQRHAVARGFHAMQFNFVVASNKVAVRLWVKLGFAIVGTLPGAFRHSDGRFGDVHVMFKALTGRTESISP